MPRFRMIRFMMLFTLLGLSAISHVSAAQDVNACQAMLTQTVQAVQESCSDLAPGNACTSSGKMIALGDIDTLQTAASNGDATEWDSTLLKLATDGQPIAMALFGGAEITNTAQIAAPTPEPLKATNKSGYNVNLRKGPGKEFEVAGFFTWDKEANVDARSADGNWLRIRTATSYAWVASELVSVQGDINSLPILSTDTVPMQQFTLTTPENSAVCGVGAAGLLVSHSGSDHVGLGVNGASLTFSKAILLLHAQPNAQLSIDVIDGKADVNADGQNITANQGETAEVPLGGADGLEVNAAPQVKPSYPFSTILGTPIELVSDKTLPCTAGLVSGGAQVSAYVQPSLDTAVATMLVADAHYPVVGWLKDEQGANWWRLEDAWVRQADVRVAGACDQAPEVSADAPPTTSTNMSINNNASQSILFSTGLVPAGDTIWTADPGHDILSGTCATPPLPVCSHPVAITPNGTTLSWRGQEPLPYTLSLTGDNAYTYNGRNHLNNGKVTMALTFTSPTTWLMTMTQVFDNDPSCIHTLYYSAVPR